MSSLWIDEQAPLPPSHFALPDDSEAPGLLAIGPSVHPARLEEAYRHGVFPWYSAGQPPLWWTPDPRMVLQTRAFRISRSLRKTLRRFMADPRCALRIDSQFDAVIAACAQTPREGQSGTWIVPELIDAYRTWHRMGRVHSVETWIDGALVGGLYGVCIGRMFFGESMFSWRTDASKIALSGLVAFCRANGITMIDCQQHTGHLASLGAREVRRHQFEAHLAHACAGSTPQDWSYHPGHWAQLGLDGSDLPGSDHVGADQTSGPPPAALPNPHA